jgi:hypothetical protein
MNPIVEALDDQGKMLRGSKPSNSSVLAGAIETGRQEVAAAVAAHGRAQEAYTASLLSPDPCETQARHAENVAAGIEVERRRVRLADIERKHREAERREAEQARKARRQAVERDVAAFSRQAGARYEAACGELISILTEMAELRARVEQVNAEAPGATPVPDPEWLARNVSPPEVRISRLTERLALPGWRANDRPHWLPTPDTSPATVLRRVRLTDGAPPRAPSAGQACSSLTGSHPEHPRVNRAVGPR